MSAEEDKQFGDTALAMATFHVAIQLAAALSVSADNGVTLPVPPFLIERIVGADMSAVA